MKYINKIKNLLYFDIIINILILAILTISLIPNSFSIIPIKLVKPFLGINLLIDIFESLHFILIGISIIFITQSIILINEFNKKNIKNNTVMNLLFYKWLIQTINCTIPYAFNIQIPLIFIIMSIIIFSLIWYVKLESN